MTIPIDITCSIDVSRYAAHVVPDVPEWEVYGERCRVTLDGHLIELVEINDGECFCLIIWAHGCGVFENETPSSLQMVDGPVLKFATAAEAVAALAAIISQFVLP